MFHAILRFLERLFFGQHVVDRNEPDEVRWRRDPLSHPDLRRMSQRELADLPFDPHAVDPE